jgi:hypothetical protein
MATTARDNYRRKRGRKEKGPPFVQLHYWFLDCEAWHRLTPAARCAYLELARLYNGTNNGTLSMSVRRLAEVLPCSRTTASRVLTELELTGFIMPVTIGTFSRKDRLASEYRLTAYRCDLSGALPTKAFDPSKRWKATVPNSGRTVPNSNTVGSGKASTVPNSNTVSAVSSKATVPIISTHIESYHAERGATEASAPDLYPDLPACLDRRRAAVTT